VSKKVDLKEARKTVQTISEIDFLDLELYINVNKISSIS
jgi:hypothetical protein